MLRLDGLFWVRFVFDSKGGYLGSIIQKHLALSDEQVAINLSILLVCRCNLSMLVYAVSGGENRCSRDYKDWRIPICKRKRRNEVFQSKRGVKMNPLSNTTSADTTALSGIVFFLGLHQSSITSSPFEIMLPPFIKSDNPSRDTMLASQGVLSKDWASPKEDVAWENL